MMAKGEKSDYISVVIVVIMCSRCVGHIYTYQNLINASGHVYHKRLESKLA